MSRITVKHLKYFAALARHGHFGRAAEDCAVSQPALSIQMKDLEEILGAPLLERQARQLHLTRLGEVFALRASEILRSIDDLDNLARASQDPFVGQLRFGLIPTVAPYYLPKFIKALAAHLPQLDLRPNEAVTRTLLDGITGGRLDTAIVALPVSEPGLHEEPLLEEEFVLVRPREDAHKPVPDVARLQQMRLLLLEEGHCFREQALSFCKLSSGSARQLMEGSSLSTLVQMVGAGIGVTLIPEMAIPIETRSASVSVVRLAAPQPHRSIGMVWRKTNPLAGHLAGIAAVIRRDYATDSRDFAHR